MRERERFALFVILLLGLLAIILVPSFYTGPTVSQRTMCKSHLRSVSIAASVYSGEYKSWPAPNVSYFVKEHFLGSKYFTCPSTGNKPTESGDINDLLKHCDYIYVPISSDVEPQDAMLAFELPANHNQAVVNFAQIDGCVKSVRHDDMDAFRQKVQDTNDLMARLRRESE